MGSLIMLVCVVCQLLIWDLFFKLIDIFSRRGKRTVINRSVSLMCRRLMAIVQTYGGVRFEIDRALRKPTPPTIVCANHQSVADIAVLLAGFPNHQLRFVAKKELSRGFPAVSEVLRTQEHVLLDRNGNPKVQAKLLKGLGQKIDDGLTPAIFPEGTRSRDGVVGTFQTGGARTLLGSSPVGITAVAIDGGYRFSSIQQLRKVRPTDRYRATLVGFFQHDGSKREIRLAIELAREAIVRQIDIWRAADARETVDRES